MKSLRHSFPLMTFVAGSGGGVLLVSLGRAHAEALAALEPWFDRRHWHEGYMLAPILVVALAAIAVSTLLFAHGGPVGQRVIRAAAFGAATLLFVFCSLTFARALRRPHVDEHITALFSHTWVVQPPGVPRGRRPLIEHMDLWGEEPEPNIDYLPGPDGFREVSENGLHILQSCGPAGCRLAFFTRAEDLQARPRTSAEDSTRSWEAVVRDGPVQEWDQSLRIARDPLRAVHYLKLDNFDRRGRKQAAYELRPVDGRWEAVTFSPALVTPRISAPSLWLWTGFGGLVLIGCLYTLRRRVASRRKAIEAARRGELGDDGRVTFEDGTVARVEPAACVPPGPVLVLRPASAAAYREDAVLSPEDLRTGSLDDNLERLRYDLLRCDAAVFTVACLSAAPLVGAALAGLVI